jgi:hypothetical protein
MKLATGLATVEDFETGEYHEEYRVVYETKTRGKLVEALKWFAQSEHKKVLVVPDREYTKDESLRSMLAEHLRWFEQPKDCFISVIMKHGRVYLEKT